MALNSLKLQKISLFDTLATHLNAILRVIFYSYFKLKSNDFDFNLCFILLNNEHNVRLIRRFILLCHLNKLSM